MKILKQNSSTAPILAMWQDNREMVLETDAPGWATGRRLNTLKSRAPKECNYDIHDKELLTIMRCLNEWRGELIGLERPFTIQTDHKNLKYFMTP